MAETLRDIVGRSDDIYVFSIDKKDEFDRRMWEFRVTDRRSPMYGLSDKFSRYDYRVVTLRRGDHFFLAYRFMLPDGSVYFVDIRKANHKTSVRKYVDGLVNFYMKSNDISYKKDDSSFKISEMRMKSLGIDNFIDLCHHFRPYSAIGIGYTRDVRNLVVLDIDVDCRERENRDELDTMLVRLGSAGILPNFEIHNNTNGHIQMQWLIQPYRYKRRCEAQVAELVSRLGSSRNRNCEVGGVPMNYTYIEDTDGSAEYRLLTRSLTDMSDKPKFGDRNFTFWKAKNFCTALYGLQNLELMMPVWRDGRVTYLSKAEMVDMFSTREGRRGYCEAAPEFGDILLRARPLLSEHMEREWAAVRYPNEYGPGETLAVEYDVRRDAACEDSRNNFVFSRTKTLTWEICKRMGLRSAEDIAKLPKKEGDKLDDAIHEAVHDEYVRSDISYGGRWPGTSNQTPFSRKEFESAFRTALNFAKCKFNNLSKYSDEQRERSVRERGLKKDMKVILVDHFMHSGKGSRKALLDAVNIALVESGQKGISMSSLKRYMEILRSMSDDDRRAFRSRYREEIESKAGEAAGARKSDKRRMEYVLMASLVDAIIKDTHQ